MVLQDHMKNENHIANITMLMVTNVGLMVTYLEQLLPINSLDHINVQSCKITQQSKIIIYSIPQYLWLSNLAGWG